MKQAIQLPVEVQKKLLIDQQHEIDAFTIYTRLIPKIKDSHNQDILRRIAKDEAAHYKLLKSYTGKELKPNRWKVAYFFLITYIFGLTFGLKLLEKAEDQAQTIDYKGLEQYIPGIASILEQEEEHEHELLAMIDEEKLQYLGSIVLGLNDALVELTGTLAGLSFAFQNTRIIALSGLITGIAASFSMGASEYLSAKADGNSHALKSSIYTGITYIVTVGLLVLPYLLFHDYRLCLAITLAISLLIIFLFTYYISIAKELHFLKRFGEMAGISLGVAGFSFGIGVAVKLIFNISL